VPNEHVPRLHGKRPERRRAEDMAIGMTVGSDTEENPMPSRIVTSSLGTKRSLPSYDMRYLVKIHLPPAPKKSKKRRRDEPDEANEEAMDGMDVEPRVQATTTASSAAPPAPHDTYGLLRSFTATRNADSWAAMSDDARCAYSVYAPRALGVPLFLTKADREAYFAGGGGVK